MTHQEAHLKEKINGTKRPLGARYGSVLLLLKTVFLLMPVQVALDCKSLKPDAEGR